MCQLILLHKKSVNPILDSRFLVYVLYELLRCAVWLAALGNDVVDECGVLAGVGLGMVQVQGQALGKESFVLCRILQQQMGHDDVCRHLVQVA